jgi:hypothetical protein
MVSHSEGICRPEISTTHLAQQVQEAVPAFTGRKVFPHASFFLDHTTSGLFESLSFMIHHRPTAEHSDNELLTQAYQKEIFHLSVCYRFHCFHRLRQFVVQFEAAEFIPHLSFC